MVTATLNRYRLVGKTLAAIFALTLTSFVIDVGYGQFARAWMQSPNSEPLQEDIFLDQVEQTIDILNDRAHLGGAFDTLLSRSESQWGKVSTRALERSLLDAFIQQLSLWEKTKLFGATCVAAVSDVLSGNRTALSCEQRLMKGKLADYLLPTLSFDADRQALAVDGYELMIRQNGQGQPIVEMQGEEILNLSSPFDMVRGPALLIKQLQVASDKQSQVQQGLFTDTAHASLGIVILFILVLAAALWLFDWLVSLEIKREQRRIEGACTLAKADLEILNQKLREIETSQRDAVAQYDLDRIHELFAGIAKAIAILNQVEADIGANAELESRSRANDLRWVIRKMQEWGKWEQGRLPGYMERLKKTADHYDPTQSKRHQRTEQKVTYGHGLNR